MTHWKIIFLIVPLFGTQLDVRDVPGYDCGDCHGSSGWDSLELSGFNHQMTAFPLLGSHDLQSCNSCHKGTTLQEKHQFQIQFTDCASCHLDIHGSTLGDECTQCHSFNSWQVTERSFDHESTQFSLLAAHRKVLCKDCHTEQPMIRFDITPTDCYSCHRTNYDTAIKPTHNKAQLDIDCKLCHTIKRPSWRPSTFNHDLQTAYELTGGHRTAECFSCHTGQFSGIPSDCWSCHQIDFESTGTGVFPNSPDHNTNPQYSKNCELCHITEGWGEASINHDLTEFPLTGLHLTTDCSLCHINDAYDLPLTCDGCHKEIFQSTKNPDHQVYGYPEDYCDACHSTLGWTPQQYTHNLDFSCSTCHLPDYSEATDPIHSLDYGFSLTCETCHIGTETWSGAIFEHVGINDNCSTCHMEAYANSRNPDHNALGFGTQCEDCHLSTTDWQEATFDHDNQFFPIYSGKHKGTWTTCGAECHLDPNQFSYFSCGLDGICHEHDQGEMNSEHTEVSDYAYDSQACFQCHPTGEKDDDEGDDGLFMNWKNHLKNKPIWKID